MRTSGVCFSRMWVWIWLWVIATLRLTVASDDSYPHYGIQGMVYVGTNYVWGFHEIPHKVSWHDGYYGPELVKVELTTNVVSHPTMTWDQQLGTTYFSNRVVRVTTPTSTNDVVVGMVGQRFEVTPPTFAPTTPASKCKCQCCTKEVASAAIPLPDRTNRQALEAASHPLINGDEWLSEEAREFYRNIRTNRHLLDYHSVIVPYIITD